MQINDIKNIMMRNIIEYLKTCYDPEIPVNIWDLGLIYRITINNDFTVEILMTLTSPNCPAIESLPTKIKNGTKMISYVKDVNLVLTFDPPYSMEMMSDEAKLTLGLL